jgi:hypothetical protein
VGYFDTANHNTLGNITGADPTQLVDNDNNRIPESAYNIPVPGYCSSHTVAGSSLVGHTDLSGLYYITGGMSLNNSHENIAGTNVPLIFLGGKVTINGSTVNLTAPPASYSSTAANAAIPGVVIYMP